MFGSANQQLTVAVADSWIVILDDLDCCFSDPRLGPAHLELYVANRPGA